MAGRWRSSLAIFRAGDADDNLCFAAMRDAGRGYYWEEVWKLLGETWQQVMAVYGRLSLCKAPSYAYS